MTVFSKDKRETNEVVGMLPGPTLRVDFTCTTYSDETVMQFFCSIIDIYYERKGKGFGYKIYVISRIFSPLS